MKVEGEMFSIFDWSNVITGGQEGVGCGLGCVMYWVHEDWTVASYSDTGLGQRSRGV